MSAAFLSSLSQTLSELDAEGLTKRERLIASPQAGQVTVEDRPLINLCANNYLGLADHPRLVTAARDALRTQGYGMASVRFICGTQVGHRDLETRLSEFFKDGRRDTLRRVF